MKLWPFSKKNAASSNPTSGSMDLPPGVMLDFSELKPAAPIAAANTQPLPADIAGAPPATASANLQEAWFFESAPPPPPSLGVPPGGQPPSGNRAFGNAMIEAGRTGSDFNPDPLPLASDAGLLGPSVPPMNPSIDLNLLAPPDSSEEPCTAALASMGGLNPLPPAMPQAEPALSLAPEEDRMPVYDFSANDSAQPILNDTAHLQSFLPEGNQSPDPSLSFAWPEMSDLPPVAEGEAFFSVGAANDWLSPEAEFSEALPYPQPESTTWTPDPMAGLSSALPEEPLVILPVNPPVQERPAFADPAFAAPPLSFEEVPQAVPQAQMFPDAWPTPAFSEPVPEDSPSMQQTWLSEQAIMSPVWEESAPQSPTAPFENTDWSAMPLNTASDWDAEALATDQSAFDASPVTFLQQPSPEAHSESFYEADDLNVWLNPSGSEDPEILPPLEIQPARTAHVQSAALAPALEMHPVLADFAESAPLQPVQTAPRQPNAVQAASFHPVEAQPVSHPLEINPVASDWMAEPDDAQWAEPWPESPLEMPMETMPSLEIQPVRKAAPVQPAALAPALEMHPVQADFAESAPPQPMQSAPRQPNPAQAASFHPVEAQPVSHPLEINPVASDWMAEPDDAQWAEPWPESPLEMPMETMPSLEIQPVRQAAPVQPAPLTPELEIHPVQADFAESAPPQPMRTTPMKPVSFPPAQAAPTQPMAMQTTMQTTMQTHADAEEPAPLSVEINEEAPKPTDDKREMLMDQVAPPESDAAIEASSARTPMEQAKPEMHPRQEKTLPAADQAISAPAPMQPEAQPELKPTKPARREASPLRSVFEQPTFRKPATPRRPVAPIPPEERPSPYKDSFADEMQSFEHEILLQDSRFLSKSINRLVEQYFSQPEEPESPW